MVPCHRVFGLVRVAIAKVSCVAAEQGSLINVPLTAIAVLEWGEPDRPI